ncbi:CaiB/BaiF CoA transferase family protein [Bradyrhizobium sp. USDA 4469]
MKLLDGIRVIDLGSFITAPLATMVLAEMGADVIKVERGEGDPFRQFANGKYSPHFQAHNRNKRSVLLNYDQPADFAALQALLKEADVVVMNARPGVMEKLNLGYDALHATNPRLIWCGITGFGPDGPYAQRPAFDNVGQALSGWMSRFRIGDDPRVRGPAISDAATGLYAAIAILGALNERHASGIGRRIDISMLEATIALGAEPIAQYLATERTPSVIQRAAMSQAYTLSCADGKRIGIHLSSPDKFWVGLCNALGRQDWIAKFPTRMDRVRKYEEIAQQMNAEFARPEP